MSFSTLDTKQTSEMYGIFDIFFATNTIYPLETFPKNIRTVNLPVFPPTLQQPCNRTANTESAMLARSCGKTSFQALFTLHLFWYNCFVIVMIKCISKRCFYSQTIQSLCTHCLPLYQETTRLKRAEALWKIIERPFVSDLPVPWISQ